MTQIHYQYIYGPVYSWRLGMSLGIDPLSKNEKICNFNCSYCQLGNAASAAIRRQVFIPTEEILKEIKTLPQVRIDYITFSGSGEPTLALNLGEMIDAIRKIRKEKIAVITNSALIAREDVQSDLAKADFVLAKLDAANEETFVRINHPADDVNFETVFTGLRAFRKKFKGKLALQVMLMEENRKEATLLAECARKIHPDEVQINTPLRPSPIKPLTKEQINVIKKAFHGLNVLCVYDENCQEYHPFDDEKTARRHGKFKKSV